MTTGVVTFDAARFIVRFPQFAAYNAANPAGLQMFFDEATLILNNTATSRVQDVTQRAMLLNLLTAHIATLGGVLTVAGPGSTAGQVGRVSSGAEGSVSVSLDMGAVYGTKAYFMQTQWGAQYWQMTSQWRTMRYIGAQRRCY